MKKFLTVVGLLAVIATPAFAQSFDPDEGTGNELPFAYGTKTNQSGNEARAAAPKSIKSMQKNENASQSPTDNITEGPAALREFRD